MIRLLIWFVQFVIVGPPIRPRLAALKPKRCIRHGRVDCSDLPAIDTCATGLCCKCCEARCECVQALVRETVTARAEVCR